MGFHAPAFQSLLDHFLVEEHAHHLLDQQRIAARPFGDAALERDWEGDFADQQGHQAVNFLVGERREGEVEKIIGVERVRPG